MIKAEIVDSNDSLQMDSSRCNIFQKYFPFFKYGADVHSLAVDYTDKATSRRILFYFVHLNFFEWDFFDNLKSIRYFQRSFRTKFEFFHFERKNCSSKTVFSLTVTQKRIFFIK